MRRNRELQRSLYGEPLGDRLRRLLTLLDISQARLAQALGVAPATVSQLISGRRAKIGTSDVLGRLVLLERHVTRPGFDRDDPSLVARVLDAVRDARPLLDALPLLDVPPAAAGAAAAVDLVGVDGVGWAPGAGAHDDALAGLRAVAAAEDLVRAAEALDTTVPSLAAFLRRAAR